MKFLSWFKKDGKWNVNRIIGFVLGLIFVTGAGMAWLDVLDYFINGYTLIVTGVLEVLVIGWCFKTSKVLDEVNRNTVKFSLSFTLQCRHRRRNPGGLSERTGDRHHPDTAVDRHVN